MATSLARDAVAFLMDLAEKGEIDPWDVKVIDVIDRFLAELNPFTATHRTQYESTLSQSGQAFLYASMLILLKADNLVDRDRVEPVEEAFVEEDFESERALPAHLERQIRRRAVAHPPQRRRVTLQELINQLEVIAAAIEDNGSRPRVKARQARPQSRSQAIRTIAQLAHQENLTEMAVMLEEFFSSHWDELSAGTDWIDFNLLLEFWMATRAQEEPDAHRHIVTDERTHEKVGVFWALLLLSAQNKVELSQENFYQDLKVKTVLSLKALRIDELATIALLD